MKNVDLSRRSFVAGAALAAGAAGVAGAVPLARADEVAWDGTYDVIVCGGGGSGLTAAYSALEQGAEKVLVLEKGDACGGTTATAEGAVQASGTTWQKELGVNGVDDDSADKHYAFWMQDGEGLVDPDLVRVMADNAADNLQWMADSFGITYSKVFGCYPAAYTDPANMADRIHLITDAADATKTGGVVWTTNAEAAVREAGGEIMTGTAAAHLVMGDDGVYRYAVAERSEQGLTERLRRVFAETVQSVDYACNQIVIKTLPGGAHAAAEMVDTMRWKEVVGTLAGDNTILVILRDVESAPEVAERFKGMMK